MPNKPLIYIDTSVVGGCFDKEFKEHSLALFGCAANNRFIFLVSDLLLEELELAPDRVQRQLGSLDADNVIAVNRNSESEALQKAYLKSSVIGSKHSNDAHHVALATVNRADLIVSWNFKHIVHYDKIKGFNAVNLLRGYSLIDIRSPREVV